MKTPSPLIAGEPVREGWSHELIDHMRSNALKGGIRGVVRRGAGGTTITPAAPVKSRPSFASVSFGTYFDAGSLALFKGGVQFALACIDSVIYIRKGNVSWAHVPVLAYLVTDDDNYYYIDAGATPWEGVRYSFVEINLNARTATPKLTDNSDVPMDDPLSLIVRWPLSSVAWTGTAEDTERVLCVVETWHVGHIKIPCIFGPPL